MSIMHFNYEINDQVSTNGNLVVSALILTPEQKKLLNAVVDVAKLPVSVRHAANGFTHIYSNTPNNILRVEADLLSTLKWVLAPNQYARIMKHVYNPDFTFWTKITDFCTSETPFVRDSTCAELGKSLSNEWVAEVDVDIEDITDALTQIPESEQHKILEFSGFTDWRDTTVEEWTGTSLFRITDENLIELKKYFTDLYDWGVGDGHTEIKFHEVEHSGDHLYAITGLFGDHATLNEDFIEENNLNFDDFEESIVLIDLLKKFASPDQELNVTVSGFDSRKCFLFVHDFKV